MSPRSPLRSHQITFRIGCKRTTRDVLLTARAATNAIVSREASDWTNIKTFAHGVSGIVSVGLNAVAFVKDTYR